jgi:predicted DNA-binding transcriptional regulator AlpA
MIPAEDRGPMISGRPNLAKRYGISAMTTFRWEQDEALNFPKHLNIGGRLYWRIADLVAWEQERAAKSANLEAAGRAQARLMAEKRARRA